MRGTYPLALAGMVLLAAFSFVQAKDPTDVDLSKRRPGPSEQRAPAAPVQRPKVAEGLIDRRFETRMWDGKMSRFNQRSSSIQVRETQPKKVVETRRLDYPSIQPRIAPQSGRVAFVRNFDRVRENRMAPLTSGATVVRVQEVARPAPVNQTEEMTMRDINRFTFRRNSYSDEAVRVQPAASGERVE